MEQVEIRVDIPTVYVGETSRSIYERSGALGGSKEREQQKSHGEAPIAGT